jgi:glycosyltransferase involved in cell wall biosynthesis
MNVLYHLPILPPKMPEAEAISQEIALLQTRHPGQIVYLNPHIHLPKWARIPRMLFGLHLLPSLWSLERRVDVHHFYNPDPFPFPMLRWLRKPVVYSLTGGLHTLAHRVYFSKMGAVTAQDEATVHVLKQAGLQRVTWAPPWTDASRFTHTPPPQDGTVRLMLASAPWTQAQFESKGVQALLDATVADARLHLVMLWREVLHDEILRRVAMLKLQDRVTIINGKADVNATLAGVHAAIVLAKTPQLVKAYPHSLLDALAAGKPVLVSAAIPMAEYVQRTQCGAVVATVSADGVRSAIDRLMTNYTTHAHNARAVGQRDFSPGAVLNAFDEAYALANALARGATV